jgi:hypothetical protein
MWPVIFFGTIGLLVALVVVHELRGWRRTRPREQFDRSADEATNYLLAEQQARALRNQNGFGNPGI